MYMLDWSERNEQGKPKLSILDWIVKAYNYIGEWPEMIKKSFKVTEILNALDGSEDELIRNDELAHVQEGTSDVDDADDESEFEGFHL